MKQCSICMTFLPLREFAIHKRGSRRRRGFCYECQRSYHREIYRSDPGRYKDTRAQRRRLLRASHRARIIEYLRCHPCVDCGEADINVLEFDHVYGPKSANLSDLMRGTVAWRRIEIELAKCQVRCANCHRRRTAAAFGWFRYENGT